MSYIVAACEECKTLLFDPNEIEDDDPRVAGFPVLTSGFYAECRTCAAYNKLPVAIQKFYRIDALSDL